MTDAIGKRCNSMGRARRRQRGISMIELLISMSILSLVTAMVLLTWFALNNSFAYTTYSSNARDFARQGLSRMQREIRDTQVPFQQASAEAGVVRARTFWIELYTTFNESGNRDPALPPHLVIYRLYEDGSIWRFEDGSNGIPGIQNVATDFDLADDVPANYDLAGETLSGEGATLILSHVVNSTQPSAANPTPLFMYSYVDVNGIMVLDPFVVGVGNRSRILGVQVHLLVDLNPTKAPVYADFVTTAQLRNQRSQ